MIAAQTAPSATEALQEQPIKETTFKDTILPFIPTFEQRILMLGILFIVFISINIWAYLRKKQFALKPATVSPHPVPKPLGLNIRYRDPEAPGIQKAQTQSSPKNLRERLGQKKLHIFNIILGFIMVSLITTTIFMRPVVIGTTPEQDSNLLDAGQSITFEFDIPIQTNKMNLHISPETAGNWKFEKSDSIIPVTRKVTFEPTESFYPGSEIVVYVVGIESFSGFGGSHEHALEFKAPKIPAITSITPENGAKNVTSETPVEITYNAPIGDFVETTFDIIPDVPFSVTTHEHSQTLNFTEGLDQDSEYTVSIYQTPRSYNTDTGENIEVGETKLIGETTFSTVSTPFIEDYSPKGTGVLPDTKIRVVFDQEMNPESVESRFSIEPAVEGDIEWDNDRTLVFTPFKALPKDTEFTITFKEGLVSAFFGEIPDEIVLSFTTIGQVKVTETSPVGGSYGIDPSGTNISVTFDQEVDHPSAENHFSISPAAGGSFSWDGNTMTYLSAGKLGYSTTYTVSISSGVQSIYGIDSKDTFTFSFSTRDQIFSLNIPWYKQQENFTCNIAAVRMALAYRGIYLSEAQIKAGLGIGTNPNENWVPGYGVHWNAMGNFLSSYRSVTAKQGWTLEEILTEVENGNPVVLWWYNRYSQPPGSFTLDSGVTGWMGMHSEVVRGYVGNKSNPSAILTNDPWRGQLSYSQSLFMSTWAYIGYAAVVVR